MSEEIKDDRPRWEHSVLDSEPGDTYEVFCDKLNAWGFEGWEVISISESKDPYRIWTAWLKRKYRFERNYKTPDGFLSIVGTVDHVTYV